MSAQSQNICNPNDLILWEQKTKGPKQDNRNRLWSHIKLCLSCWNIVNKWIWYKSVRTKLFTQEIYTHFTIKMNFHQFYCRRCVSLLRTIQYVISVLYFQHTNVYLFHWSGRMLGQSFLLDWNFRSLLQNLVLFIFLRFFSHFLFLLVNLNLFTSVIVSFTS